MGPTRPRPSSRWHWTQYWVKMSLPSATFGASPVISMNVWLDSPAAWARASWASWAACISAAKRSRGRVPMARVWNTIQ